MLQFEWVINREERHLIFKGKILWFIVEVFVDKVLVSTYPDVMFADRW
jgi:hypothetical protein